MTSSAIDIPSASEAASLLRDAVQRDSEQHIRWTRQRLADAIDKAVQYRLNCFYITPTTEQEHVNCLIVNPGLFVRAPINEKSFAMARSILKEKGYTESSDTCDGSILFTWAPEPEAAQ